MHLVQNWAVAAAVAAWLQTGAAAPSINEPRAGPASCSTSSKDTYDYIVVGSGPGALPVADRLSEAGHSVLLLEKGPASSGRWGGTMKPSWLSGTNLTRFDVPGLCNQIWADRNGIACTDYDQLAGCILGGGAAINSGLYWKPHPDDWNMSFPVGWKNPDMQESVSKVFGRLPGTMYPSMDGKLYLPQGYNTISAGLTQGGWTSIVANDQNDQRNKTFSHTTYYFSGGERGGPMATYLLTASQRKNFAFWTGAAVKRVVRTGGHVTGVEVECSGGTTTINVTPNTGRVIISAGTFGSAKILWRSGIGPKDQLNVVKQSGDGATMISSDQWIDLPVGYNLYDHVGTDLEIAHPNIVNYDFYAAYNRPASGDSQSYLNGRTGILTQAAPNFGPMFWDIITPSDGINRHLHWQARVEGSRSTSMTLTQYLGTGSVSRGRLTINSQLKTIVSTSPYLNNAGDVAAVVQGVQNLRDGLAKVSGLTWIRPSSSQSSAAFVNSIAANPGSRNSNHWIGTNKMGTDDGRSGGTAVVDTNTKVYGTDNLFVVDASIFPGHVTSNPTAAILIVSEHAVSKILALPFPAAAA
ncbi:cellobiose dehydrogenase [Lasiosphaeria ovina]|uniref:Cellobiose dehydrogenase n=1 Tax=Lasiosphaeria ovina TaxID=92902 RepID=A0AAE0NDS7_9PEZI|nr:cellobiose dehydrogenase [Lasiosphaeria ovina]